MLVPDTAALESIRFNNALKQSRRATIGVIQSVDQLVNGGFVEMIEATAECIDKKLFHHAAVKRLAVVAHQDFLELAGTFELLTTDKLAAGIERFTAFKIPPTAHGVEILKRKPERVHAVVAGRAFRIGAVAFKTFAQGRFWATAAPPVSIF